MLPDHVLVVLYYAAPGGAGRLSPWLADQLIPTLLALPGVQSATRYASLEVVKLPEGVGEPDATVIFGLETDDTDELLARIDRAAPVPPTDVLDPSRTMILLGDAACILQPVSQ